MGLRVWGLGFGAKVCSFRLQALGLGCVRVDGVRLVWGLGLIYEKDSIGEGSPGFRI